jgi:hypothetical protein
MMNYDDREGKNPVDINKVHDNEQKVAANGGTVMRPNSDGTVSVINPATGQVLYTGSASGASNSQANNGGMRRKPD